MTKIFLKSRFFLISNTRKPLKKHNSAKWTSETIQISYCFNIVKCFWLYLWIFSSLLIKNRKIWKIFFLKTYFFFWNCSKIVKKSLFFNIFRIFSFLNRTLGLRKSFLNQTTYVLKNRLYPQSFLNRDSFLNRAFLNQDSTVHKSAETIQGRKLFKGRNYSWNYGIQFLGPLKLGGIAQCRKTVMTPPH